MLSGSDVQESSRLDRHPPAAVDDEPAADAGRRRVDRLVQVAGVLAVITPIAAALWSTRGHVWYPTADDAVIELQTFDIPGHVSLYGAYSRDGFHHPGPAELFVLALPARLFGAGGLLVGAALINMAAVGATALALSLIHI